MNAQPLPALGPLTNPAPPGFLGRPNGPFLWGRGGRRMSPEEIDLQRRLAAQQMSAAGDFSPVQHWSQGLARVAGGVSGALQMRRADRAAEENRSRTLRIAQALAEGQSLPDGSDPVAAALADPELRQVGLKAMDARQPKPVEPVIQRANNGDILGLHPMTGEVLFTRADPNPKPSLDWIMAEDPQTGARQLIPVGPSGPILPGSGPAALPTAPVGKLTPIDGGPTPSASGSFRP